VVALKNPAADSQPAIEKSQQKMTLAWPYGRSPHLWRLDSATIPSASSAGTDREHRGEQTRQPSGWQGATGSSLGVTYQQPVG
jgi:hypothetical protein